MIPFLRKLTLFKLFPVFILLAFFLLPATPSFPGNTLSVDTIQGTSFSFYYNYISPNGRELWFGSDSSKNSTVASTPFIVFGNPQGCSFDSDGNLLVLGTQEFSFDVFAISPSNLKITLTLTDKPDGSVFTQPKSAKTLVTGRFSWSSPPDDENTIVFEAFTGNSRTGKKLQRSLRIIKQSGSQSSSVNQTSANTVAECQGQADKLCYRGNLYINPDYGVHILADEYGPSIASDIHPIEVNFDDLSGGTQPNPPYNTLVVSKGQTLSFNVTASAPGSSGVLTLKEFYLPEGAQFTPPPKQGPVTGQFQWPVSAAIADGTYTAIFGAYLGSGTTTLNPTFLVLNITTEPPPEIGVDNASFTFSATIGGQNPTAQTLTIQNTGEGTLNWTATKTQPWLTINPSSGSLPKGNSASASISVDTTALSPGTYTGSIVISGGGTSIQSKEISVTLTLTEQPPALEITPTSLTLFSATVGNPTTLAPNSQTITVRNAGGGSLTWSALKAATWLTLSPSNPSGSLQAGQSESITVSASISGLGAATYTDEITFSAPGAVGAPQVVSATLNLISTTPAIGINATSKAFSATAGGANPASQTFSVWNAGGGTLNWTATKTKSWLTINPASGSSTGQANSNLIAVSVNISGLSAGTHTDTITVSASGVAGVASKTINITLTLAAPVTPPSIGIYALSNSFSATVGGSNPASSTLYVWNAGGGVLNWTATKTQSWLTLSPTSGSSTGQANSNIVSFSVNISGLSAGTYTDTITVSSPGVSNSPQSLSITLTLTGATTPWIGIDASSIPFSATVGDPNPTPRTFSVWNAGVGTLNWTATKTQPWLTINPASGSSTGPGNSTPITVSVDITGLSAGTYTDTITASSPEATNSPKTVSVTLTVLSNTPLLDLSPVGTLNFSFPVGSTTALTLPFYVKNVGAGTLNWSLSYTQPAWVTSVSIPTGGGGQITGPGQTPVNISVLTSLPVGSTDYFTITVNGGDAGTKEITVNLNVIAQPSGEPLITSSGTSWNGTTSMINVNAGQVLNYSLTNTGSNYTYMSITIYTIDMATDVTCLFTFPDGRSYEQRLTYGGSSNAFNFRSLMYSFGGANISDLYMPQGPYTLRITGNGNGRISIRTTLQ